MITRKIRLSCICVFLLNFVELTTAAEPHVTGVQPEHGSLAGQTRITIDGRNFAKNQFSFGDGNEHIGNQVTMVSATKTFPCEIHVDGSHETQLMCYTVPMPEDDYHVRVAVDGVDVPEDNHCNCKFRPSDKYTPKITSIIPRSGKPGSKIKITGKIVTDRYGSNLHSSSNGLSEKMLRVYFGGQTCELKDLETDELYGMTIDGQSWNGNMDCKVKGTFIGHTNGSFIVEGGFGRSAVDSKALHVSSRDDIYMFQTYTGIGSLSHNSGSVKGGLRLSIYGQYFDETQAPVKVMVGTTECRVVEPVKDEVIVCEVEAEPSTTPTAHTGNRGLVHEIWNATTKSNSNFDDVRTLSSSAADYSIELVDETAFHYTDKFNYVDKMKGFFVPPKTGDYKFYMLADDGAKLYLSPDENAANLALIAETSQTSSYFKFDEQASNNISLVGGNSYAIEIIYRQGSSTSALKVAAKLFKTEFTASMTANAVQEIQKLNINSVVTKDTFTLTVTDADSTKTATSEIQTVAVEGPGDCTFRLGMYGAYTALISVTSSYEEIQKAIEALPGVLPDKVDVTITQTSNGANIQVTFNSKKGDLPDMTSIISAEYNETTTITVTESTKGLPSLEGYQFMMDGIPSPIVSPTATADEVKDALLKMFSVQCPDTLGKPSGTTDFKNYEISVSSIYGTPVSSPGPFCGRQSTKNPRYLFYKGGKDSEVLGVPLSQYKALCLAFKGKLSKISMRFSYEDGGGEVRRASTSWTITAETPAEWVFQCWDILDKAKTARSDSSDLRVDWLTISRASNEENLFIDSVSIGRSPLSTDSGSSKQRMAAAKPNGALIRGVEVTSSSTGVYTIVLDPFDCGNDFPMLEIAHAKINSGSSSSTSSASTYTLSNGASNIGVKFARTVRASVPVTGYHKIGFNGQTTENLLPSLTAKEVEAELESLSEFGDVSVVKTGDCANFVHEIKWVSKSGDQPVITVDNQLEGNAVTHTIQPIQDGGLFLDPIPGDMLRTSHSQSQVRLWINNIPAACDSDCSFDWSSSQTPTVSSVTPTSGTESLGTSITITGTGFDGTADNNTVVIGGVPCGVTASTATTITCTVGNGPTGSHNIQVTVDGKGDASGTVAFEYVASIQSISPNNGSIGGGTTLTVTGYGFMSNVNVTVGGTDCPIISSGQAEIVCTTPLAATTSGGAVDVIVTQSSGSPLTSPTQFTYDASSGVTPVITAISTTTSPIQGGANITIAGTGFGASNNLLEALKINNIAAVILSYTDTSIEATLPSNQPGSYPILLYVPNQGYADLRTNSIANIVYNLEITNIFPSKGSLYGGTRVTITGQGFPSNTLLLDIKFGRHVCDVESLNSTQVICVIRDTGIVHTIRNNGTHPDWGYGYEWYPKHSTIYVGDKLRFVWSFAKFLNGVTAGIRQKVNASSTLFPVNGFTSGPKKANGVFEKRLTRKGIVNFWSDYVDEYEIIFFVGTVRVQPRTSHFTEMTFKVAGHEAVYSPGGANPSQFGACPGTTSAFSGCTDPEPTPTDASKFNFIFWSCLSPVVNKMTPPDGTTNDLISLEGSGFGSNSCENEIKIGTAGGLVQTASPSAVSFKVDPSSEPAIGRISMLTLRVNNLGNALIDLSDNSSSQTFSLRPFVSSITPASGSTAGGTKLTITGSGFQGTTSDITVNVDVYPCTVESVTYTEIVCSTPALAASTVNVSLTVAVNGQPFPAECASCSYTYSSDDTPIVSAANPSNVTGSDSITIDGVFGDVNASLARVVIADQICTVTAASGSQITCDVAGLPNGDHALNVFISGKGKASGDVIIRSPATISSLTPTTGSVHGGAQLTIDGNGFNGSSVVTVNGKNCVSISESFTQINCTLPANAENSASVVVLSNGQTYDSQTFGYVQSESPTVSVINPTTGTASSTLSITGTGYSSTQADNTVFINDVPCVVSASTQTSITCTLGTVPAGSYPVKVLVDGVGFSDSSTSFTYQMVASSISHSAGSSAGGQTVTIDGTGFVTSDLSVTICGETCTVKTSASQSSTQYVCLTPASTTTVSSSKSCDVIATQNSVVQTLSGSFSYQASLTPEVTGVSPARGGTAGGTTITITGTGFGTNIADVTVTIADYSCNVTDVTAIQITCITGSAKSVDSKVVVEVDGNGMATQTSADFEYIDVWSSIYTWGGNSPPAAGDLVVIPANQTILLDTDTPVLKMLLIQGGKVIFDAKDVELKAEYVLITDGGVLQVGTEAQPFMHKGIITLYGHVRSKELPIYGAKCLAVREGTLDLHGRPTHVTWTLLASTANPGDTQITLKVPVEWQVNDEIVIATTSHRHSQKESEVRKIANISGNKMTLTLDKALTYKHLGITETIDGRSVDFRAEVGLLTHNVVVRGSRNQQWVEKIEACPAGFNTGEFATQTCFQGRFGEEMGSDQYGAQIIMHAPRKDENLVIGRLEYVEVTFAGQAFRLGRYPVHFHLNGRMEKSYVRGLGIHKTFNRAVNVHNTHNVVIEHTVIYDVMGGSFFLEDGIETGNQFIYNLAVFVRSSSSLLNDDVTPAAFWATNPNNTISNNHVAGGTHFGIWYRMHDHPEGPSHTTSVCPKHVPLGEFLNNTVHSNGWFGLWIFPDYFPRENGDCSPSTPTTPAVFRGLTSWNCEKGAEFVNGGALQFEDFVLVNNEFAGFEGKTVVGVPQYTDEGPMLNNSLIVGSQPSLDVQHTFKGRGIVLPYLSGFQFRGVTFVNFESQSAAIGFTSIAGVCLDYCGGFKYKSRLLRWVNAPNRASFRWLHEGVLEDEDGTLSGTAGNTILPTMGTLPPTKCTSHSSTSKGMPASSCQSDVKFHRFAFNNAKPASLEGKDVVMTNEHGSASAPFATKRLTHKPGWAMVIVTGLSYSMVWENGEHLTNISYTGVFGDLVSGTGFILNQQAARPDRFMIDGATPRTESEADLDASVNVNGDWKYNATSGNVAYVVAANTGSRKKRAASSIYSTDRPYNLRVFRCYYTGCIPPPDPRAVFVTPNITFNYSNSLTWETLNITKPVLGDDLTIPADVWLMLDESPPKLGTLKIEGGLEFTNDVANLPNLKLEADIIYVTGRLVVGWEHTPHEGNAEIVVHGTHASAEYVTTDGPSVGAKAIGVFGGLELHGKDRGISWTKLAQTADSGTNSMTLTEAVEWVAGDEIVISTTSFSVWQTETFKISAISGDKTTLTLNDSLSYKHIAFSETLNTGEKYTLAASVGLLTRNIKIRGAHYDEMMAQSFGARIIVGRTASATKSYVGFARIANTEFIHTGQEGYVEFYDPRYSVAFVDVKQANDFPFPSFVKSSAFHNGFAPAIGLIGVDDMVVENNVIHQTVGSSIVVTGSGNKLIKNLMVLNQWPGSYLDRREPKNIKYDGSVEALEAVDLYMSGNVVAGSERIGYHLGGESCTSTNPPAMEKNEAHGCLIGVGLLPTDKPLHTTCARYANYTVWKNGDFGIYYNNAPSARFTDNILVENKVSLFPMIIGPGILSHAIGDEFVEVTDSLFVGHSPSFDCALDKVDGSDVNIQLSSQGRSFGNGSMGVTGLITTTFTSGSNNAPEKPFINIMSYNTINGIHHNSGLTFARFATHCTDYDYAISTNPSNDDAAHPVTTKQLSFDKVGENNKVLYHIPSLGKINSADCVDMDCDGLKKGLIVDLDGTLLNGNPGSVIPWSEYQWDGDRRRGLGDYRIPKTMLTDVNGNRIDINVKAPNKGIVRNNQCVFKDYWRAYECHDIEHKMLTIESMDSDTETRRVSPVAVLVNRYVDLINGPQDHGWCSGYTCRKRVSTFQSLVQTGQSADIFFTGTTPQKLRFVLLDADVNDTVRVSVLFNNPNRLDVYVGNTHKLPKNGKFVNNKFILTPPKTPGEFKPDITEPLGTNYVSREENTIYVILRGSTPVEIRTASVIIVSFSLPAMTVDDFFGENLVQNLAAFFDLDPRKVRVVNVINENGAGKRRKRTTPVTQVVVEIGDAPGDSGSGSLTYESLTTVNEQITTQAQFGSFDSIVNATVLGISTINPTPPTTNAAWSQVTTETNPVNVITRPSHLEFVETVVAGKEQNTFTTSPMIRVKDTDGNYMTVLGASTAPWQITATLRAASGSDSRGVLSGTKIVTFVNGWANFTDFSISHMGSGYIIDFAVTAPAAAANLTLATAALAVPARTITANLVSISTSLLENENIELILDLRDADTASVVSDIAWRNHTWYCEASLADPSLYAGTLSGTTNLTFDTIQARAAFQNLTLSSIGTYYIDFHIYTEPAGYDFHYEKYVVITNAAQNAIVVQRSNIMEVKLDGVFDPATAPYIGVKVMNYYIQKYKNTQVRITGYTVSAGSILVSLSMEGSLSAMNSSVFDLCDSVENGTSFTYGNISLNLLPHLKIDGSSFYGVSCGQLITTTTLPPPGDKDDSLHPGIIAALVILSIALVAVIVAFIVWKFCVKPKTKTHDMYQKNNYIMSAEDTLFSQKSFSGLNGSGASTPVPPVDTSYILPIDRHNANLKFKL